MYYPSNVMYGRSLTTTEGSGVAQLTTSYVYGRDTSTDGKTSYLLYAYVSPTEQDLSGIQSSSGITTRKTQYAYYPLIDPHKDLVQTQTEPSVETPGNIVTTTYTYSTNGLLNSLARQGYVNGASTTYTTMATYDSKGRVQTVTGPCTDVTQTTTYGYYPDTDTDMAL